MLRGTDPLGLAALDLRRLRPEVLPRLLDDLGNEQDADDPLP